MGFPEKKKLILWVRIASAFLVILHFFLRLASKSANEITADKASILNTLESVTPRVKNGTRFLTTISGCRMARWLYVAQDQECATVDSVQERVLHKITQLQNNDTVFVPHGAPLEHFIDHFIDDLSVDIVVISGRTHNSYIDDQLTYNLKINLLLNNPHILCWFCQNVQRYGGGTLHHPKLFPFPYGLKELYHKGTEIFDAYKKVFYETLELNDFNAENKSIIVYAGPLGNTNAMRSNIPRGKKLPPEEYFREMSKSKYILSPDGDRPECYRHYEAIGLGTVPITQLDPFLHRHLSNAGVHGIIFNNWNWNITSLEAELDLFPAVNRNLIWENFWEDWIDDEVGRKLHWNNDSG